MGAVATPDTQLLLPFFIGDEVGCCPKPAELRGDSNAVIVNGATPVKRRGKSMSRRAGQTGHIEQSGKWWVVRWWMDVPNQEKRILKRGKICPISGPGTS